MISMYPAILGIAQFAPYILDYEDVEAVPADFLLCYRTT